MAQDEMELDHSLDEVERLHQQGFARQTARGAYLHEVNKLLVAIERVQRTAPGSYSAVEAESLERAAQGILFAHSGVSDETVRKVRARSVANQSRIAR